MRFSKSFKDACKIVVDTIEKPFRPRGLLNAATMEAVMVAIMEQGVDVDFLSEAYDLLLKDTDFLEMITSNTSNIENVKSRQAIAGKILFGNE